MLDENSQWLIEAVREQSSNLVKKALEKTGDPNAIDENTELNALHEAIVKGNIDILNLLIDGITGKSTKKADINIVGHNFEAAITLADKANYADKFAILQKIIKSRNLFDENLLDRYILICLNNIGQTAFLQKSDFALLAHYVSRLCGTDVGKILKKDKNDDRYLAHLCQYSYAEKDGEELEGWHASEFLPIRIFSLFEILVKLKRGMILLSPEKKEAFSEQIRQEILIEVETYKLDQERLVVAETQQITEADRDKLYLNLAEQFLAKIEKYPGKEFCIASGYKGHSIYLGVIYNEKKYELHIRYDNLGVGIQKVDGSWRHQKNNVGLIFPRIIKIPNFVAKKTKY